MKYDNRTVASKGVYENFLLFHEAEKDGSDGLRKMVAKNEFLFH